MAVIIDTQGSLGTLRDVFLRTLAVNHHIELFSDGCLYSFIPFTHTSRYRLD